MSANYTTHGVEDVHGVHGVNTVPDHTYNEKTDKDIEDVHATVHPAAAVTVDEKAAAQYVWPPERELTTSDLELTGYEVEQYEGKIQQMSTDRAKHVSGNSFTEPNVSDHFSAVPNPQE